MHDNFFLTRLFVLLSCLPYFFIFRVITLGYKRPLEREDLFELNESDSSYTVCPTFEKQWRKEVLRNQERQKVKVINYKVLLNPEVITTCKLDKAIFKYEILLFISKFLKGEMTIYFISIIHCYCSPLLSSNYSTLLLFNVQ